jgi:hypothetical protein
MGATMKLSELPKHDRVSELLLKLGLDRITVEEFWNEMRKYGLTDEDIDRFCTGVTTWPKS